PAAEQEGSSHRPAASDARSHESAAKKGGPHSLPAADVRTGAQSGQRPRPGDTLASLTILELLGIVVIGSPLDLPQLPHRPQPAGFRLLLVLRIPSLPSSPSPAAPLRSTLLSPCRFHPSSPGPGRHILPAAVGCSTRCG